VLLVLYTGCWKVLSQTRKETSYNDRRFWVSYILFIIIIGGILVLFIYVTRLASNEIFSPSNKIHQEVGRAKDLSAPRYCTGVLISPKPDQEGNRLQWQKILSFMYPIYNHNWRNISTIYIYITRLPSNEIFSPSNKIHQEVGRAKDLSAPRYYTGVLISPKPDQEGNRLQWQKILSFIYPIYNRNWRNISTIYIYNKTSIKRNILTIKENTSGSRSG